MQKLKSYKFRLLPNAEQKEFLNKSMGCCRYIYNHFLAYNIELYKNEQKSLLGYDLIKELTVLKQTEKCSWLYEIPNQSLQQSLRNLDTAYKNFFRRCKQGDKEKGFPKFKKKSNRDSFKIVQGFKITDNKVKISNLKSMIKFNRSRHFDSSKVKSFVISKEPTGKYFISFLVEEDIQSLPTNQNHIGIDLGLNHFLTTSNGDKIENPKNTHKYKNKINKEQRRLSRKIYKSKNYEKQRIKVAKVHEKIHNSRLDFLHKTSTKLIRENQSINMEDLNVKGMVKNHKLAKSISDVSWSEFTRQLTYKADWYGRTLTLVDQWYPSSKLCNICNYKLEKLDLSIREWKCPGCNTLHDRDINAAINIRNYTVGTTGIYACGDMKQPAFPLTSINETRNLNKEIAHYKVG